MFKNASIYKIKDRNFGAVDLSMALEKHAFSPIGLSQEKSIGFVRLHSELEAGSEFGYCRQVPGAIFVKLRIQTKTVPASVVKELMESKCDQIMQDTGRKPGKKERRELSEDIRISLLPQAFPKTQDVLAFVDRDCDWLVIDSASQAMCDDFITALVKAVDGLSLQMLNVKNAPASVMATWLLHGEQSDLFNIGSECELKAADESKATVRYKNHQLDTLEVQGHIVSGKMPTKLALESGERMSFVMTDDLRLTNLAFLDVVFEGKEGAEDGQLADMYIIAKELREVIAGVITIYGGEVAL